MPLIETFKYVAGNGHLYDRARVACDVCGVVFERALQAVKEANFCGIECTHKAMRRGGVLSAKIASTNITRYGGATPADSAVVLEKMKNTSLEGYGSAWPAASSLVREKIASTNMERYGVDNYAKTAGFLEAMRSTTLSRHGVEWPCLIKETQLASHAPCACSKSFETRKKNGRMKSSSCEDAVCKTLASVGMPVARWATVNGWSIDALVTCRDMSFYLQVDGVRWHGLDRPLERVMSDLTLQGIVIAKKYKRDRDQDMWFANNGLTLVRVTDVETKYHDDVSLLSLIISKLGHMKQCVQPAPAVVEDRQTEQQ